MPEISVQLIVFLLGVGAITALAAVSDTRALKIPNRLTLPMFFGGLIYQGVFNGLGRPGLADAGLAFLLGFGVMFLLWIIGGGGGGDVKLIGALSVWLGFRVTLQAMVASTACVILATGAVLTWSLTTRGAYNTKRKYLATGKTPTNKQTKKKRKQQPLRETVQQRQRRRIMAYAVPVALSTWAVVIWNLPTFPF